MNFRRALSFSDHSRRTSRSCPWLLSTGKHMKRTEILKAITRLNEHKEAYKSKETQHNK